MCTYVHAKTNVYINKTYNLTRTRIIAAQWSHQKQGKDGNIHVFVFPMTSD